jgi:hypothetical protein
MSQPGQPEQLDNLIQVGVQALRDGERAQARALFQALARRHPDHVKLLLWLAASLDSPAERRGALERVLEIDPQNAVAQKGLAALDAAAGVARFDLDSGDEAVLTAEDSGRRLRLLQSLVLLLVGLLMLMALLLLAWPAIGARRPTFIPASALPELPPTATLVLPTSGSALAEQVPTILPVPPTEPRLPRPTEPAPVPSAPGSFYEQDGWRYGVLAGTQSASLGQIGALVPQGRFVVVRLIVANSGPTPRALNPADLRLVDAQGRVYLPLPEASLEYLNSAGGRGVAGDLALSDLVPNSGGNVSVPLAFDVALDASGLLLVVGRGAQRVAWSLGN